MSEKILITPESLEEKANTLRGYGNSQRDAFAEVETLIKGLVSGWEGEAQTAFVESYEKNKQVFDQFIADIERFAKVMADFATAMRTNEAGAVRNAQGLA